jgi:hypothetical protein
LSIRRLQLGPAAIAVAAMNIQDLEYVMAAAAAGNLSRAARSLGVSTSTISGASVVSRMNSALRSSNVGTEASA